MSQSRIEVLRTMLERRPDDARLRFGLAVEYLNSGDLETGVTELQRYLETADDEGNAWGRLASALDALGRTDDALAAYRRGIEAAHRFGHPTMAEEFEEELDRLS